MVHILSRITNVIVRRKMIAIIYFFVEKRNIDFKNIDKFLKNFYDLFI